MRNTITAVIIPHITSLSKSDNDNHIDKKSPGNTTKKKIKLYGSLPSPFTHGFWI